MRDEEQGGCAGFWGPTKPFFSADSTQAGCSYYVDTKVMAAMRCLISVFLVSSFAYIIVIGKLNMLFVTNWSYVLFTFSYISLTICSVMVVVGKWKWVDKLAKLVIPVYFLAATAALVVIPIYYAFLGKPPFEFFNVVTHGGTFIVHIVDIILGARYRFCLQYFVVTVAYLALYIAFIWIRFAIHGASPDFSWPYAFLDPKNSSTGSLVGIYIGLLLWTVGASILVLLTTRLIPMYVRRKPSQDARL